MVRGPGDRRDLHGLGVGTLVLLANVIFLGGRTRIIPCVPASGPHLEQALAQLGLELG